MRTLCKYLGGSHAYRLNGPDSDKDYRGVFLEDDPSYMVGLDAMSRGRKFEVKNTDEVDLFYYELRHFLFQLRKGDMQAIECLFNDTWEKSSDEWEVVLSHKNSLIDTKQIFTTLCGYVQNERRLMLGERTGKLGGKRRAALEEYGYSYKNAVQVLRLLNVGVYFFLTGTIHVNTENFDIHPLLVDIKHNPENHTKDEVDALSHNFETLMKRTFDTRHIPDKTFSDDIATEICIKIYGKELDRVRSSDPFATP